MILIYIQYIHLNIYMTYCHISNFCGSNPGSPLIKVDQVLQAQQRWCQQYQKEAFVWRSHGVFCETKWTECGDQLSNVYPIAICFLCSPKNLDLGRQKMKKQDQKVR